MGQATEGPRSHVPVMVAEVLEMFAPIHQGVMVDATYGGGGHSMNLLRELPPAVEILAVDRDPEAVAEAQRGKPPRLTVVQANYGELEDVLADHGIEKIAGALFDVGVSSDQLDSPERGFSYRHRGPLDMRMGPDAAPSAAELVNEWPMQRLAEVIRVFGEERFALRIAEHIVASRPIADTLTLAEVVRNAIPAAARRRGGHPARRTFQALRIAVNDELGSLERGLEAALSHLEPGGRCVVISYHSLEDRIVKRRFSQGAQGCVCPPELPVCTCGRSVELVRLTRGPLRPSAHEIESNPRSRSARLRAVEKAA